MAAASLCVFHPVTINHKSTRAPAGVMVSAWLMVEKKTVILHIRIEESVAKALKSLATADDRKISPYVARLLRRHVEMKAGKQKTGPAR